jgi:C-terminal processing protease CtpA/Prc
MKRIAAFLFLVFAAQAGGVEMPTTARTARLVKLCKVWGAVKLLHPWVWTRDIDWDAALLHALPKARAATTDDEFVTAVDEMLAELHDPVTRVISQTAGPRPAPRSDAEFLSWPSKGVLLVRLAAAHAPTDVEKAISAIKGSSQLILDARFANAGPEAEGGREELGVLLASLITHELRVPALRWLVHDGYRAQNGEGWGGYQSMFEQQALRTLTPKPNAVRRPVAVVVNEIIGVPDEAIALQGIGEAVIIVQGTTLDDLLTAAVPQPLDAKHVVRMRQAEIVPLVAKPRIDTDLSADADNKKIVETALAKVRALAAIRSKLTAATSLPPLVWRADRNYPTEKQPSVELRLLALFRMWNVIDRFYPYKELFDESWDDVLTTFIPVFEGAEGANAYVEAVADLATHIPDGHVRVRGGDDPMVNPPARAQILSQMIEGHAVVVAIGSDEATLKSGIRVGDVIVSVDGEPIAARLARFRRFLPGSNDPGRDRYALQDALAGAEGSTLTVRVRAADGSTREAKLVRHIPGMRLHWRVGDIVRLLDGNVGYVDLDRLESQEVDGMFEKLKNTRAIIFDMRGYPNGTGWDIAPRLNIRSAKFGAAYERCIVRGNPADEGVGFRLKFLQQLPPTIDGKPLYRGKTFMLVDERTGSQAETTGLFLEAAAGTKFVGSRTVGQNGDVTLMTLPGGLTVSFSGHNVRHADGRQLQRVGLPIDYPVTPTIRGVQTGRDEVLQRALCIARATC